MFRSKGTINPRDEISTYLELIYDGVVLDSLKDKKKTVDLRSATEWRINQQLKQGHTPKKVDIMING